MHIDLSTLTDTDTLFRELCRGLHVSEAQPRWYSALDAHFEQYRGLYRAIGYSLKRDPDQFFYFDNTEPSRAMSRASRTYALLIWCLFDLLADKGLDPDAVLFAHGLGTLEFDELLDRSAELLAQQDIDSRDAVIKTFKTMAAIGLAQADGPRFTLLSPARRYLRAITALGESLDDENGDHGHE